MSGYLSGFSIGTISKFMGPEQSHLGQIITPVAMAVWLRSSALTTYPHWGQQWTCCQCLLLSFAVSAINSPRAAQWGDVYPLVSVRTLLSAVARPVKIIPSQVLGQRGIARVAFSAASVDSGRVHFIQRCTQLQPLRKIWVG